MNIVLPRIISKERHAVHTGVQRGVEIEKRGFPANEVNHGALLSKLLVT